MRINRIILPALVVALASVALADPKADKKEPPCVATYEGQEVKFHPTKNYATNPKLGCPLSAGPIVAPKFCRPGMKVIHFEVSYGSEKKRRSLNCENPPK